MKLISRVFLKWIGKKLLIQFSIQLGTYYLRRKQNKLNGWKNEKSERNKKLAVEFTVIFAPFFKMFYSSPPT